MTDPPHDPAEVYAGLRARALGLTPEELELDLTGSPRAYGVLMETGYANAVVTLVALGTGDASLYFSTGGGVIGGVGHQTVAEAARQFVAAADHFQSVMSPTAEYPLPDTGATRFYVLTTDGIVAAHQSERDLGEGRSPLSPLFYAGHNVITQLRMVTEQR